MSSTNTTPKAAEPFAATSLPPQSKWSRRAWRGEPPAVRPRSLLELGRGQCRFCVAEAPEGAMDQALFCAAPAPRAPYCPDHRRRCRVSPGSLKALEAEVEAALAQRR
jgi:hypothetical protein